MKIKSKNKVNKLKALSAFAFLLAFSFTACTSSHNVENSRVKIEKPLVLEAVQTPYTGDGIFHDANWIADDMNLGLNLGNTMEAYDATNCAQITYRWPVDQGADVSRYESCWGAPETTQEIIDGMKAAGFDTVRIPVFWGNMMVNDDTWTINPLLLNRVREIVDYCMKDDLYAVVNIHHFDEFVIRRNTLEDCQLIFTNLWTQIASYFANYGEKLIFEGFNEYIGGQQFNSLGKLTDLTQDQQYKMAKVLNQAFVSAVRSTGGNNRNRVLVVSGIWTNIDLTSSDRFVMPKDSAEDKLMVSVHYVDNTMFWTGEIGTQTWIYYIDDQIGKLKKRFLNKGIPVFMGECTASYVGWKKVIPDNAYEEYNESHECLDYYLGKLMDEKIVPVIWDTPNDFYSRKDFRIKDEKNEEVVRKRALQAKAR